MQLLLNSTVAERDNVTRWADQLAEAISRHLGIDLGEHSTRNNPWKNAIEALEAHDLTVRAKP